MVNTYFKTDFASSRSDLIETQIPTDQLMPFAPYATWVFGNDDTSLTSKDSNKTLTASNPSTTFYSSNSVTISALKERHLQSDVSDDGDITVIGVTQFDDTAVKVLVGNLLPSASTASSNWGLFASIGDLYLTLSPNGTTKDISSSKTGATLAINDYFAFAISIDKTAKTATVYVKNNGVETVKTYNFTNNYLGNGNDIAFGDSVYLSSKSGNISYSDVTVYKKSLNINAIKKAAGYAITRASERGITI